MSGVSPLFGQTWVVILTLILFRFFIPPFLLGFASVKRGCPRIARPWTALCCLEAKCQGHGRGAGRVDYGPGLRRWARVLYPVLLFLFVFGRGFFFRQFPFRIAITPPCVSVLQSH